MVWVRALVWGLAPGKHAPAPEGVVRFHLLQRYNGIHITVGVQRALLCHMYELR
jgi:hypothetical protein